MHDALCEHESRTEFLTRPNKNRVPRRRLFFDETGRRIGAIAQQVCAEIFRNLLGNRSWHIANCVNRRIGQSRERHVRRINQLFLCVPFRRNRMCERTRGRGERITRRRLHRLAVEQNLDFAALCRFGDGRAVIETLA